MATIMWLCVTQFAFLHQKYKILNDYTTGTFLKNSIIMVHAIQNVHEALKLVLHVAMLVLMPSQILNMYLR